MEATVSARRRTLLPLTADDFLAEVRQLTVDWPGKTVRIERNSMRDHWQLPASSQPAIAELYHENSKLFGGMVEDLAASRTDVETLRSVVTTQRSRAMHEGGWPVVELPARLRQALATMLDGVPQPLLFAFDLRVVADGVLAVYDPIRKTAYGVKKVTPSELAAGRDALALLGPNASVDAGAMLFLVASFARNQMLFGPRGYRRTLVEAGRLVEQMLQGAAAACDCKLWLEYADRRIDDLAEADGVEEATVAVIEMKWSA
jgi:hypothetical protein